MKYLATDYLYEWDETHDIEPHFTDEGIEYWVLFPNDKTEAKKLAISTRLSNSVREIQPTETEYDIFELESESELNNVEKFVSQHVLDASQGVLNMPYERDAFVGFVDTNARNAYMLLAKLILYKNTTNEANKWINDIVNDFTMPSLTAIVNVSSKVRSKLLWRGYIVNLFDKEFEDYDYQMGNFCWASIIDMEEKAKAAGETIPQHDDKEQSMALGKNIVIVYARTIQTIANGATKKDAIRILQDTIRNEFKKSFCMDV